ncbi:hypothetical protein SAMN05444161_5571 [Rhizobiales bacterium GAS191]|nr:hypothetical protein SAMN05444161_5571 [Rhizobiales bacterium GAS191]
MNRPSRTTIDYLLRNSFDEEEAPKAFELLKQADPQMLWAAMDAEIARQIAKRRSDRPKPPRVDPDDPLVVGRKRLPVTGMTLSAQAVTGQPILKGVSTMNVTMIDLAKAAVESGNSAGISKAEWYQTISKLAERTRQAHETKAAAFVRYTESDPDGRLLYSAYKLAPLPDYNPGAPVAKVETTKPVSAAMQKFNSLADALRKSEPNLSGAQAFVKVYEDPANRELAQQAHEHDMRLSLEALHG